MLLPPLNPASPPRTPDSRNVRQRMRSRRWSLQPTAGRDRRRRRSMATAGAKRIAIGTLDLHMARSGAMATDRIADLLDLHEGRLGIPLLDDAAIATSCVRTRGSRSSARPRTRAGRRTACCASCAPSATRSSRSTRTRRPSTASPATRMWRPPWPRPGRSTSSTSSGGRASAGPRARGGRGRGALPVAPARHRQPRGRPDRPRGRPGGRDGPLHDHRVPARPSPPAGSCPDEPPPRSARTRPSRTRLGPPARHRRPRRSSERCAASIVDGGIVPATAVERLVADVRPDRPARGHAARPAGRDGHRRPAALGLPRRGGRPGGGERRPDPWRQPRVPRHGPGDDDPRRGVRGARARSRATGRSRSSRRRGAAVRPLPPDAVRGRLGGATWT